MNASLPKLPNAKFQACWDALCTIAQQPNSLIVSNALANWVIKKEQVPLSSGLVPFSVMMIATYQEFASMFVPVVSIYKDTVAGNEGHNIDITKGVGYVDVRGEKQQNMTIVKVWYTFETTKKIFKPLETLLKSHPLASERIICEFRMDANEVLHDVLFCFASDD